jgi:hypothetical protein
VSDTAQLSAEDCIASCNANVDGSACVAVEYELSTGTCTSVSFAVTVDNGIGTLTLIADAGGDPPPVVTGSYTSSSTIPPTSSSTISASTST